MIIELENLDGVELYREDKGRGFAGEAGTFPKRTVDPDRIQCRPEGVFIREDAESMWWRNENDHNYGGLVYRIKVDKAGMYRVKVFTLSSPDVTSVSVSGMMGESLLVQGAWDAAGKVKRENTASWMVLDGKAKNCFGERCCIHSGALEKAVYMWSYDFVCGNQFLNIEVEPRLGSAKEPDWTGMEVGISRIEVEYMERESGGDRPVVYILGDSTAKSYVFEDAPLSGWGQVFERLFRKEKAVIVNYSQGGRSLKSMYQEGRLNDILVKGRPGDHILIQSGHNDEARDELKGTACRFGRGNTEESFTEFLEQYFLPAIKARGMKPCLLSCTTRLDPVFYSREADFDSLPVCFGGFLHENPPAVDFPGLMCRIGERMKVPVIDLYRSSSAYVESIGGNGAKAMYFTLEPGESPGKSNSGSLANGNPAGFCDVAHYKECFSRQFARLIVTEMTEKNMELAGCLGDEVKEAVITGNFQNVYPEISPDVEKGQGAYYRNQIEKMLQTGIMGKQVDGLFHPEEVVTADEFLEYLEKAWKIRLDKKEFRLIKDWKGKLDRLGLSEILYYGYLSRFGRDQEGKWCKPAYMTDYNGVNLPPDDPGYDCNLVGESAVYYPLVPWDMLLDKDRFPALAVPMARAVYELGLLRSDCGISRGNMINGNRMEPDRYVTRGKAAKYLYFLWLLTRPVLEESQGIEGIN